MIIMDIEERRKKLIEKIKSYNAACDLAKIEKAVDVEIKAHSGQLRKSGEPYAIHPLEVATMLADMEVDESTIIAGLLHDVVEDTEYDLNWIREEFGDEVALLVDGVTKLGKIPYSSKEEQQAENMRKMFLSMAKDIRVIIIKLNDRLHNMRTLEYVKPENQLYKATETLEIYAPLAHRLGMIKIKWELEDLCFKYLEPKAYEELVKLVAQKREERESFIGKIMDIIQEKTQEIGIKAQIDGRPKHLYSIHKKMVRQNKDINQIYDLFAVRVIVDTVKDCYSVLGLVHELFKPMPGRFKDYIAMPKPNMYQSLHNTLIGPEGVPFEVQIRTWEMHKVAEMGIASHWKYKEGGKTDSSLDNKISWIRQLMEEQKDMKNASEFMEAFKMDLFTDEVFVFTPKGDVINLPAQSTPIDFAYSIHSAIGNRMMGAKINGEIKPLDYRLQNGDIVEIITSSAVNGPSKDWIKIVKTSSAKTKINQWFKKENREENIIKGRELLEHQLKKIGISWNELFKPEFLSPILKKYHYASSDDLLSAVGFGAITSNKVILRLKEEYKKTAKPEDIYKMFPDDKEFKIDKDFKSGKASENGIIVKGVDNCLVRLSKCCNPVPGDSIVGYVTRGRGVSVHRADCMNMVSGLDNDNRLIEVSWANRGAESYPAEIIVIAHDRNALLMEVVNLLAEAKIPVKGINARVNKDGNAVINLIIEIQDSEQLSRILKRLRKIKDIIEVSRIKS